MKKGFPRALWCCVFVNLSEKSLYIRGRHGTNTCTAGLSDPGAQALKVVPDATKLQCGDLTMSDGNQ